MEFLEFLAILSLPFIFLVAFMFFLLECVATITWAIVPFIAMYWLYKHW